MTRPKPSALPFRRCGLLLAVMTCSAALVVGCGDAGTVDASKSADGSASTATKADVAEPVGKLPKGVVGPTKGKGAVAPQ